jgi:hypothetical protein
VFGRSSHLNLGLRLGLPQTAIPFKSANSTALSCLDGSQMRGRRDEEEEEKEGLLEPSCKGGQRFKGQDDSLDEVFAVLTGVRSEGYTRKGQKGDTSFFKGDKKFNAEDPELYWQRWLMLL